MVKRLRRKRLELTTKLNDVELRMLREQNVNKRFPKTDSAFILDGEKFISVLSNDQIKFFELYWHKNELGMLWKRN